MGWYLFGWVRPSRSSTITPALPFAVEASAMSNESTKQSLNYLRSVLSKRHSYRKRGEEAGGIPEGGQRIATRDKKIQREV